MPEIAKEDYEKFRGLLNNHLPETHDDWMSLAEKLRSDIVARGNEAVGVEIRSVEFARFLDDANNTADPVGLSRLARVKGIERGAAIAPA